MEIADAARATRKYMKKGLLILNSETLKYEAGNEAKCDRLNLLAVLEAIREPSERMIAEGEAAYIYHPKEIWPAMIVELIAEVKEACNDSD